MMGWMEEGENTPKFHDISQTSTKTAINLKRPSTYHLFILLSVPSSHTLFSFKSNQTIMEIGRAGIDRLKKGEINLGTSIMAVQFNGGVVIGADSRTTSGSYIANRVTDKLTHIHDRVYCCRSGSAADTQAVADIVHYQLQMFSAMTGAPPSVHTTASIFQKLCYENKDNLSAGIIVAGWDAENGPSVYNIPLGGGLFRQPWAIGGSGSTYIYGYCDATYQEGWGEEETVQFVRNALSLAMSRDGSSGGVIRMAVITPGGVERKFYAGDDIPRFWEGKEILKDTVPGRDVASVRS